MAQTKPLFHWLDPGFHILSPQFGSPIKPIFEANGISQLLHGLVNVSQSILAQFGLLGLFGFFWLNLANILPIASRDFDLRILVSGFVPLKQASMISGRGWWEGGGLSLIHI